MRDFERKYDGNRAFLCLFRCFIITMMYSYCNVFVLVVKNEFLVCHFRASIALSATVRLKQHDRDEAPEWFNLLLPLVQHFSMGCKIAKLSI